VWKAIDSGEVMTSWNLGLALEQQGDLARAAEMMQDASSL
jgi:hypothetical protein